MVHTTPLNGQAPNASALRSDYRYTSSPPEKRIKDSKDPKDFKDLTKLTTNNNMGTFVGNIDGRLDEKGRIFVPAAYRKILAENGSKRIVMRRDTDNECLMFYPELVWNEKVEQLRQALDEWDPEDQLILMQFMADAEYMEMDSQGRILLQKKNLEAIGAQQDVLFVGMLNRFALWAPQTFAEKRLSQTELAARLRAKMSKKV